MTPIQRAASLIIDADGLLVTAGAGMGVDSGLPDFRGNEGFWNAYPALAKVGIDFRAIASPSAFSRNPRQAWGFYGHRLSLYRQTVPHQGFQVLKDIGNHMPYGMFVITSNVDGQFQKAGIAESAVMELHGSIHRLQCIGPCTEAVWPSSEIVPTTDDELCEWVRSALPVCKKCHRVARPNILMFDDWSWIDRYNAIQRAWLEQWLARTKRFVVLELGAGTGLPSIRRIGQSYGVPLIRINPHDPAVPAGRGVALDCGALSGLMEIAAHLQEIGWMPRPNSIE